MSRVLIIDDDELLLPMLAQHLTEAGHEVTTARDGAQGEKLFRHVAFDVIVTDILMPNREGLETIMTLHRLLPKVRIVAMSGAPSDGPAYLDMAKRLGAHAALVKPFDPQELIAAVETAAPKM